MHGVYGYLSPCTGSYTGIFCVHGNLHESCCTGSCTGMSWCIDRIELAFYCLLREYYGLRLKVSQVAKYKDTKLLVWCTSSEPRKTTKLRNYCWLFLLAATTRVMCHHFGVLNCTGFDCLATTTAFFPSLARFRATASGGRPRSMDSFCMESW